MALKIQMVHAICEELIRRKDYLGESPIETIYFGGGTPSLLSANELEEILSTIHTHYKTSLKETTIEVNPDDLNEQKSKELKAVGFDRLSVGIQSLNDELLKFMNRPHTAEEALNSIRFAQNAGFDNISIDLIYGIPNLTLEDWLATLSGIEQLGIQHISAYNLTIEEKTAFGNWQKKGKLQEQDDELVIQQIEVMNTTLENWGFERYEISNFARANYTSKHNSSYWLDKKYLGVGPSAHSYDHFSRQWNVANNGKYIELINANTPHFEREELNNKDRTNEQLLTCLRTVWGVNLKKLSEDIATLKQKELTLAIEEGYVELKNDVITLTAKGKLFADKIAADLFLD